MSSVLCGNASWRGAWRFCRLPSFLRWSYIPFKWEGESPWCANMGHRKLNMSGIHWRSKHFAPYHKRKSMGIFLCWMHRNWSNLYADATTVPNPVKNEIRCFVSENLPHRWIDHASVNDQSFHTWLLKTPNLTPCDFFYGCMWRMCHLCHKICQH